MKKPAGAGFEVAAAIRYMPELESVLPVPAPEVLLSMEPEPLVSEPVEPELLVPAPVLPVPPLEPEPLRSIRSLEEGRVLASVLPVLFESTMSPLASVVPVPPADPLPPASGMPEASSSLSAFCDALTCLPGWLQAPSPAAAV